MTVTAADRLSEFLVPLLSKPDLVSKKDLDISELDTLIKELQPAQDQWFARATVLRQNLVPFTEESFKTSALQIYRQLIATNPNDAKVHLEACRALLTFEEIDEATKVLATAFKLLNFSSEIGAVELKLTKYQEKPALRLSCLTQGVVAEYNKNEDSIEYVSLQSDSQLDVPEFCNSSDATKCTQRLTDLAYIGLLLQAEISVIGEPLHQDSAMLPYVLRVTESNDFQNVHWAVQERVLYERSLHEQSDIEHLERGTVQLMKVSKSLHSSEAVTADRLRYAYLLKPLPWKLVDEMAARRLVAMSDFGNAVPFYERLNQPLELVMCYSAIGEKEKALNVLSNTPGLADNAQAIMLKGDINQDSSDWEHAWSLGKLPEAKLRLAQLAASKEDADSVQKHLDDLLETYPSNYDALYLSGITALGAQDWERAAKELRRALAINDDDPRSWSNLSTALLYLEQPDQALLALKQALRTNKSGESDLKTLFNFVALSAQLANYDDVVIGISQLCELTDRGSAEYIARIGGVLPRLVTHFVKQPFTNNGVQPRVVKLFRGELIRAIPDDDPTLARLTGRIEFWTGRYWAGFASYDTALKSSVKFAESGSKRDWTRVKLYATEYADALEKDGDKEGRIEGSKACPDWKTKRAEALKLIEQSDRVLQQ